ncbi:isoleucyl-tRNA synthetase [Nematocida sp. AWRm77]|nr:isoleucyl-tRNA synthetase [Nematocida sp. AWRm77]
MNRFGDKEKKVLEYWDSIDAFGLSKTLSRGRKGFSFYDGPPFATGLPHYGHILSGTIKDILPRFYWQQGYRVERRFGWDCHGLPIEYEIDKMYGIKSKQEVEKIGIAQYNQYCREIVMKYSSEWERTVRQMGRWVDFKNGYKTMDFTFMESVWWVFKELYKKGLVYKGYRVMPYSTQCRTPMSNFEANQNYKDVKDMSVVVRLPLKESFRTEGKVYANVSLLAWTTTPWTLPSNLAVLVHPEMEYVLVREEEKDGREAYAVMGAFAAEKWAPKGTVARLTGKDLLGLEYAQPFAYFEGERAKKCFRVYPAEFVQEGAGTGLVHCAPGFGEDDYNEFVRNGIIKENEEVLCPVDAEGRFTEKVEEYAGRHVKECDKDIIAHLKQRGLVYKTMQIDHSYPFCWRSDTPLIYKAVPSWFVQVRPFVKELVEKNKEITWSPEAVGVGKFGLWLENAKDWAISRNRYWGTPIPIWVRERRSGEEDGAEDMLCVGSAEELFELTGERVTDLHKDIVDKIVIQKNGHTYRRVEEVLDCWFESGSMPYAQKHFPFENKEEFESTFPADFIAEGLDQTRGWFYTLHVLSTLLYNKPAFKNVMVTGLVLAADGKKMSKRLKNYPDPAHVMDNYGADAMRLYMISSPVVKAENLKFTEAGVAGMLRELFIPWQNCLCFMRTCGAEALSAASVESASVESADRTGCDVEDIALEVDRLTLGTAETSSAQTAQEEAALLDLWVLAEFEEFAKSIQAEGLLYRIQNASAKSIEFIGDLSRWYIRLSRDRLRGKKMDVLRFVLKGLSVVLAPFAPFFSEVCFQEVTGMHMEGRVEEGASSADLSALSVHFQLYSDILKECSALQASILAGMPAGQRERFAASCVLKSFRSVKDVVEAVRILREKCGIPLKMPLKGVSIVGLQESAVLTKILMQESNVVSVQSTPAEEYSWEEQISPDFKKINELYGGGNVQKRVAAIRSVSTDKDTIKKLLANGHFAVNDTKITRPEVVYKRAAKDLPSALRGVSVTDDVYIVADVTKDEVIERLWLKREVKSAVQKLRKKAGLQVSDQALLCVSGISPSDVQCDKNTQIVDVPFSAETTEEVSVGSTKVSLTLKLKSE